MRENVRAKKKWLNPNRAQCQNSRKLDRRSRGAYQWQMRGVIVIPRGDHCRGAIVLDAIRVGVDALMQLRGSTQRQRAEKCRENANCNKWASMIS